MDQENSTISSGLKPRRWMANCITTSMAFCSCSGKGTPCSTTKVRGQRSGLSIALQRPGSKTFCNVVQKIKKSKSIPNINVEISSIYPWGILRDMLPLLFHYHYFLTLRRWHTIKMQCHPHPPITDVKLP